MQYSSPSRKQLIRQKLIGLQPNLYQVIGVRFAHLIFNGESVEWMAVNEDGSPGHGHPDGRIRLSSNKFIDVEVSKGDGWEDKIIGDIKAMSLVWKKRTQKPERLIFVTSHAKDLKGKENELKSQNKEDDILLKAAALLHINAEKITFVHLNELVEGLSEQRFAQFVLQWFEIPFNPRPFRTVSDEINIIHEANQEEMAWIPSLADYRAGIVQVPARDLDQIRKFLLEKRECSVWGRGAAGKTTLALLLGITAENEGRSALYLDLLMESIAPHEIVDALAQHADERSLIIFDNVHLYEHGLKHLRGEIAARIKTGALPNCTILYVGRDSSVIRRRIGLYKEKQALKLSKTFDDRPDVFLEVDSESLRCVLSRFVPQFTARTGRTLPDVATAAWCSDPSFFGHDLVMFSIALIGNLDRLDSGRGGLDAVYDFLRAYYLDPYPEDELYRFIRLCTIGQYDVEVSGKALTGTTGHVFREEGRTYGGNAVANLVARGVIFERDMSKYGFRYGLVHSSFAQLVLSAMRSEKPDTFETIKECVQKDYHFGAPLLLALTRDERHGEILASICQWLTANSDILALALFSTEPQFWYWLTGALSDSLTSAARDTVKVRQRALEIICDPLYSELCTKWVHMPQLHFMTVWFRHFEGVAISSGLFDSASSTILRYLVSDRNAFVSKVLGTQLHSLTTFLQYLDQRAAKKDEVSGKLTDSVRDILATIDLTSRISSDTLDSVTMFLQYLDNRPAKDKVSGKVADKVRDILATIDLTSRISSDTLNSVTMFLQYLDNRPAKDKVSGKVADKVRDILAAAVLTTLSSKVLGTPLYYLVTFLQYLDQRAANKDEVSGEVAENVRDILAAAVLTTLSSKVLGTPLYYLVTFLQYLDQRAANEDEVSGKVADKVRDILATTYLTSKVNRYPLDALVFCIDYFDERPGSDKLSHNIADSLRTVLTEEMLLRKMISAPSDALTGFLNFVISRSQVLSNDLAYLSLQKRVETVLQSSAIKEKIVAGLEGTASIAGLGVMLSTIKKFDASIWEEILNNTVIKIVVDELAARLKPPCSLKDAINFLEGFEGYDENRLLKEFTRMLFAAPEELANSSLKEGIVSTTKLLFCARYNAVEEIKRFIMDFSRVATLEHFYGYGGPSTASLFLWNSWRSIGASPEYDSLWDNKLVKIGHFGLCNWATDAQPELLLGRTLQLWGMISCFSRNIRRPYPALLPSIYLPTRETCSAVLSLPEYDDFAPTTALILGLVALCLNIHSETARVAKERIELARTEMENQNPFINQLVDQAITWLIAEEG